MDTIYRVDMSNGNVAKETVPDDYAGLGGRALTSAIVSSEVIPTCHPLDEHNKLVMAPGGALTTAFTMHRLGLKVIMEATLGHDLASRFLLEAMEEEGLSREAITIRDDIQTSVTVAFNHGGDRSFLSYSQEPPLPEPALVERFRPRILLMAGLRAVEVMPPILQSAKKFGGLRIVFYGVFLVVFIVALP